MQLGKDVIEKMRQYDKASEADLKLLGDRFKHLLLTEMPYGITNAHRLFKFMDLDKSGRVGFDEFERMVRFGLRLDLQKLPNGTLWGLWRTLDEDESGYICAGEFGRFMRGTAEAIVSNERKSNFKFRKEATLKLIAKSEDWSRSYAQKASRAARQMEEEAARLEALLVKTSSSLAKLGAAEERLAARTGGLTASASAPRLGGAGTKLAAIDAPPETPTRAGAISPLRDASPPRSPKHKQVLSKLNREARKGIGLKRAGASDAPVGAPVHLLRQEQLGIPSFTSFPAFGEGY